MRGLIIKQPWIDYTLNGLKPFEIRPRPTNIRERIGLICAGTGEVWGEADLIDCVRSEGKFPACDLNYHGFITLAEYMYEKFPDGGGYFWILENIVEYENPKPYKHPQGAQVWVKDIEFVEGQR